MTLLAEPFDLRHQTIAFRRDDGWTGAAALTAGLDLRDLQNDELEKLLLRAKDPPQPSSRADPA